MSTLPASASVELLSSGCIDTFIDTFNLNDAVLSRTLAAAESCSDPAEKIKLLLSVADSKLKDKILSQAEEVAKGHSDLLGVAKMHIADAKMKMDDFQGALDECKQALNLAGSVTSIQQGFVKTVIEAASLVSESPGKQSVAWIIEYLESALHLNPPSDQLQSIKYFLAKAYNKTKDYKKSIQLCKEYLRESRKESVEEFKGRYLLADSYEAIDEIGLCIEELEILLTFQDLDVQAEASLSLGIVLTFKQIDQSRGVQLLELHYELTKQLHWYDKTDNARVILGLAKAKFNEALFFEATKNLPKMLDWKLKRIPL
jgi:tetratricopeptide (TPR) repeat protein